MKNKILLLLIPVLLFFVGALVPFVIQIAIADSVPQIVIDAENDIRSNQKRIAELRPYVQEFEMLKTDNAVQVGRLQANGYDFDWSSSNAVKNPKE